MINNPVATALTDAAGLGKLIGNLIALGMIIASIMVLLYLVLGGIEWISSQGDKAGLEAARNRITNALLGLAIVVASWAMMTIVSTFLGLPFPNLPIPTLGGTQITGGKCPNGNAGQPGEVCSNLNKCDIAGGCNGACCQSENDCLLASGKKQNCPANSNGYCRSGKSCQAGTEH